MGAVFAIPYARMTDWYGGLAAVRAAGFRLLALTPDVSAVPVSKVPPGERAALMLGTEGDGLSSRWRTRRTRPSASRWTRRPGRQASTRSTSLPPPRSPATS